MNLNRRLSHSGCVVEHVSADFTIKYSFGGEPAARLRRQAAKQRAFREQNRLPAFTTPAIISEETLPNAGYSFEMKRCHDASGLLYVAACNPDRLRTFGNRLCELIEQDLESSPLTEVRSEVVTNKFNEVLAALERKRVRLDKTLVRECERRVGALPDVMTLPVGRCHGDLTLSNMMASAERITLIDFLDTYLETPLQDICKLRQDTSHLWTLLLYGEGAFIPSIRVHAALRVLDRRIHERFQNREWYRYYYNTFQLLNLLRILPYAQHAAPAALVTSAVAGLLMQ